MQLTLDASGGCAAAGIGLTNVGLTPIVATAAEAFLRDKPLDAATLAQAAEIAAGEADPVEDRRGGAEYKRDLVRVLATRALRLAATRAAGTIAPMARPFTHSAPVSTLTRS